MLMREIFHWLYCENCLCAETLRIADRTVGPSCLRVPTLAIANTADAIAPRASISPFIDAIPAGHARLIEHAGEIGVACNTSQS